MIASRSTAGFLSRGSPRLSFYSALSWSVMPDWFGMLRTVMMVLGGLVVIAIVLVVSVAIISGVMGMIGKLRKRSEEFNCEF